jgi:hypothetical protein
VPATPCCPMSVAAVSTMCSLVACPLRVIIDSD